MSFRPQRLVAPWKPFPLVMAMTSIIAPLLAKSVMAMSLPSNPLANSILASMGPPPMRSSISSGRFLGTPVTSFGWVKARTLTSSTSTPFILSQAASASTFLGMGSNLDSSSSSCGAQTSPAVLRP